ncbi:MAG: 3-oxoadipate enol-lactonase 2 [Nitrospirae bacterium]|nr:MAG: putative 3-oxoadipate enol-lactonase [Nitrospira sp. OLB3]MBV6471556.1 3-oxoadipate enol-lactonase 2 [Nitrospirota bacterium]MCE7966162.1 alpha/beta fold hydrolase [Nitrospira sp. NTP2]MCK6492072.1 alpha/beta fold hydrolase [Nitrospira sp.]MEB2339235.1 alpha/beta fold hydrolase [Nitrospirales bacterium]
MFYTSHGLQLAYDDQGTGLPVVFLHAFPLNRSMWRPQITALSARFRTISVDLRGHGESDAPLWAFTLEQYADDVAALLDHLSIDRAVLVGLSMGGYVSLMFTRKYVDRLKGLILADTRAQADSAEGRVGRFLLAQKAYREGTEAVAEAMLPKLLGTTSLQSRPDLQEYVREVIMKAPISGIVVDLMAMTARPDSVPHLPTIPCRTLVLVGDEDQTTPLADAQVMASGISKSRLATIPGAGHLSNLENPDVFNVELQEFLEGLP